MQWVVEEVVEGVEEGGQGGGLGALAQQAVHPLHLEQAGQGLHLIKDGRWCMAVAKCTLQHCKQVLVSRQLERRSGVGGWVRGMGEWES